MGVTTEDLNQLKSLLYNLNKPRNTILETVKKSIEGTSKRINELEKKQIKHYPFEFSQADKELIQYVYFLHAQLMSIIPSINSLIQTQSMIDEQITSLLRKGLSENETPLTKKFQVRPDE